MWWTRILRCTTCTWRHWLTNAKHRGRCRHYINCVVTTIVHICYFIHEFCEECIGFDIEIPCKFSQFRGRMQISIHCFFFVSSIGPKTNRSPLLRTILFYFVFIIYNLLFFYVQVSSFNYTWLFTFHLISSGVFMMRKYWFDRWLRVREPARPVPSPSNVVPANNWNGLTPLLVAIRCGYLFREC